MTDRAETASRFWISLIALLSGVVCLVYEIVWSRYLQLILGVSAHAVATVLTCFMVGLAIGAWHVGRWIDRAKNQVRVLLWMELGIGIYVAISPLLYRAILLVDARPMQIALAVISLFLPTYLMGGTFPTFIRIASRQQERIGSDAGIIYAVNTIGGALGAFVTGFFLIGTIGLSMTLYIASAISFVIAAMIRLALREIPIPKKPEPPRKARREKIEAPIRFGLLATVFGVCGFTALAYEVYWTRLLSLFFKNSIYDLTIVLTTFLAGLSLGSIACAILLKRIKHARDTLAFVLILIGFSSLAGLYLIERFPYLLNHLQTNTSMVERFGGMFWLAGNALRFGYALLLMFVPTFLFGAVLPLVSAIGIQDISTVGRKLGLLSGINTLGAALGALAAGFLFIGTLGVADSISLTAFLNIVAGLLLVRGWVLRIAVFFAAMVVAGLAPRWDRLRMSVSFLDPNQPLETLLSQEFYREDIHGITSVVNLRPLQRKYLVTNRLFTQNSSEMMGLEDHRRLGHIPMLLHARPQSVLAVGLGAGITLRGIADHPATFIDCVEISPAVVEAARFFRDENANVLDKPNVHVIVDDARHYMRTAEKQYDVIVLDIFHPMSGGSSMIFSREYFELCRKRMAPRGLICQWLPAHQLSMNEIKTVAATFQSVFPHVSLWYGLIGESTAVVGLIGSENPLSIDYPRLAEACKAHPELREIELQSADTVLSHFIMADQSLRDFVGAASIDTDDRPIVELAAPRVSRRAASQGTMNLTILAEQVKDVRPFATNLTEEQRLLREVGILKRQIDSLAVQ